MTSDRVSDELLPCPFCGSAAKMTTDTFEHWVECSKIEVCIANGAIKHGGCTHIADAIRLWNLRSPVTVSDEMVDRVCKDTLGWPTPISKATIRRSLRAALSEPVQEMHELPEPVPEHAGLVETLEALDNELADHGYAEIGTLRATLASALLQVRDAATAVSAISSLSPSTGGWQPIERAPRDGSWIIGHFPSYVTEQVRFMRYLTAPGLGEPIWDMAPDGYEYPEGEQSPTHWKPLPDPPAGRSSLTKEKQE